MRLIQNFTWLGWVSLLAVCPIAASAPAQGQTYSTVFKFDGASMPEAPVTFDSSGNLYGTTYLGLGYGTAYKLDTAGKIEILHAFSGGADGRYAESPLLLDSAGNLYGTTDEGGNFNGTTCGPGCGVIFKIDSAGNFSVLYAFQGSTDGAFPLRGNLVSDGAGNLFGTTFGGGKFNSPCDVSGCGVVFKVDSAGHESVLYSFTGGSDGFWPLGGLFRDAAGNLYGTTEYGGIQRSRCALPAGFSSCGVIFKIDTTGTFSVLYRFRGDSDVAHPSSALVSDSSGNLYGSTYYSGDFTCGIVDSGCGSVFKLSPSGVLTIRHVFTGAPDGANPNGLLLDGVGNLYGTTTYGGNPICVSGYTGCGTIFKIDAAGNETIVYNFLGPKHQDGFQPLAGLTADAAGNFYGTTSGVAPHYRGTIFKLIP